MFQSSRKLGVNKSIAFVSVSEIIDPGPWLVVIFLVLSRDSSL